MAANLPRQSVRVLSSRARSSLRTSSIPSSQRTFSSSRSCAGEIENEYSDKPRWSYTPPGTKAPFSLRQIGKKRLPYPINEDPEVLDQFYIALLGPGGDKMLSEELKWLAVTHKSFDQGRRGFNDRLALLGKRVVQLQTSLALIQNPGNFTRQLPSLGSGDKRRVLRHPALTGLENLTAGNRAWFTHKAAITKIAEQYNLLKVLRWFPRKSHDLAASGSEIVQTHAIYAIIGAISLEKGAVEANRIARERILAPQGLSTV